MTRKTKVLYAIGCVFEEDKKVVLFPGPTTVWEKDEFNVDKEYNWISKGVEKCFEEKALRELLKDLPKVQSALVKRYDYLVPFVMSVFYDDNKEELTEAINELNTKLKSIDYYKSQGYAIETINSLLNVIEHKDFKNIFTVYAGVGYVFENSKKVVYYVTSQIGGVQSLGHLNVILKGIADNTDIDNYSTDVKKPDEKIKSVENKLDEQAAKSIRLVLGAHANDSTETLTTVVKYCQMYLGMDKYIKEGYKFVDGMELENS